MVWLPVIFVGFVIAATAFYSLAFQRVYASEHPAIEASRWINDNVPAGTIIVSDNHWDEFIPDLYSYRVWQYPVYEADTVEKIDTLVANLAVAEYLVFYSNRPYSSVSRDPGRFPLSSKYYQQLFGENLGYELDRTFTSYPGLAGVEFRDEPLGRAGLPLPEILNSRDSAPVSFNLGRCCPAGLPERHGRRTRHSDSCRSRARNCPGHQTPEAVRRWPCMLAQRSCRGRIRRHAHGN